MTAMARGESGTADATSIFPAAPSMSARAEAAGIRS
jgi:hypothetical protein